jgi:hypothetical protein
LFGAEFVAFGEDGFVSGNIKKLEKDIATEFTILLGEDFGADVEAVVKIESADEFAGELDVGDLVFAYGDEETLAGVTVHDNVGGLEGGIAEEAVGVEILVGDVVEGFFVGGDAFEPAEGRDHGEEEVEFGVFGDEGLQEDDGFVWVEAGGEVVDGDLKRVFGDGGGVRVIAGEGVPVGDKVEAVVGRIGLEFDPVLERAEVVADV